MASIKNDEKFTIILHFEIKEGKQDEFLNRIGEQVQNKIQKFPGFISSSFLKGNDGKTIFNYAQWENEEKFQTYFNTDVKGTKPIFNDLVDFEQAYYPLKVVSVFEK